jgi:hypothetical protein
MANRYATRIAILTLLCAAAATPCSFDSTPALTFRVRPDAPVERYVAGNLGVVLPEYARSHLVVAYRWLSGKPLTPAEQKGVTALLLHRLGEPHERTPRETAPQRWDKARARVRGVKPESLPATERHVGYMWFLNCTDDAFATATATLRQRVKSFGAESAAVRSWLDAQEIVFGNCDGEHDAYPAPAEATLPAVIRADRAYQTGAALFYAREYTKARHELLTVACDPDSPWRHTARLVAARALLRESTLPGRGDDGSYPFDPVPMAWAERELRAILADPAAKPIHEPARQLLRFALFRTNPQQRLDDAVAGLTSGKAPAGRMAAELADYTYLLDRNLPLEKSDDLTDWIATFQAPGDDARKHARQRWRATKKTHWLVSALVHATDADARELLAASANFPSESPAYPTIAHHRARLLLARSREDAAREELDRVLALDLPHSGRNLLLGQRRGLARSVPEFVRDLRTVSVGEEWEQSTWNAGDWFVPAEAAAVINEHMPAELLAEAALETVDLDPGTRDPILAAAWTRAFLLGRNDLVERLTPAFVNAFPALEPRVRAWENAPRKERPFVAANLILHAGALAPYVDPIDYRLGHGADYREVNHLQRNWWCAGALRRYWTPQPAPAAPPFLRDAAVVKAVADERKQLAALGAAPTWMLRAILAYADPHRKDRRVPESLSLIVRETRWGCGDEETARLTRRAFQMLHRRYPQSDWAKNTPYWYESP